MTKIEKDVQNPKPTKAQKDDVKLHEMLITKSTGFAIAEARALAWLEGPAGLHARLSSTTN